MKRKEMVSSHGVPGRIALALLAALVSVSCLLASAAVPAETRLPEFDPRARADDYYLGSVQPPGYEEPADLWGPGTYLENYAAESGWSFPKESLAKRGAVAWYPLGSSPDGTSYKARAVALYNGELIVGGSFAEAGGTTVNNVARWDGSSWSSLGAGINGPVFALEVYDGELIAAGDFSEAGGASANRIARWDGTFWNSLTGGIGGDCDPIVNALTVHDGNLIAGGAFNTAGGESVHKVAAWDGSSWSAVGTGGDGQLLQWVTTLASYDGDLYAGMMNATLGGIQYVARWDGNQWNNVGTGPNGAVFALAVYATKLFAGGTFDQAGGGAATMIASWDGSSWSDVGGGIAFGTQHCVDALYDFHGNLIVAGYFDSAGGVAVNNIAVWNQSGWNNIGEGMNDEIHALGEFDNDKIAVGDFTEADGYGANYVARWGSGSRCRNGGSRSDEEEEDCEDEYEDDHNGGCNSTPVIFAHLETCQAITVDGTSGTFLNDGMNYRDTDWYEINPTEVTNLRFCCTAHFPVNIFVIDGNYGCDNVQIIGQATGNIQEEVCIEMTLQPGRYWLWVGPSWFDGIPCGSPYTMTVEGYLYTWVAPSVTTHPQRQEVDPGQADTITE